MAKKLISVIVPAFNESECIEELAARLTNVFSVESEYEFECIVVENGSTDDTYEKLLKINQQDSRFKILKLSRNFRMDGGLTAGLSILNSDACVLMTADLQDPPELIHEFLRKWELGYENIYGVVTERRGTGPVRTLNSKVFYWLAGKLTDNRIPKNASDFRLLDRKVYESIRSMEERNRFVRGLVAWVGFKSIGIPMQRPPRFAGESKAYTFKVIDLAFKGIFAHSYIPLRVITIIGVTTSALSVIVFFGLLIRWFAVGVPFGGFGTLVTLVLFSFGILTFMLGIIAEYLGLIYEEVKQRPNYIIDKWIN